MSSVWYLVAIVGIAAVGIAYLRTRRDSAGRRSGRQSDSPGSRPDYEQDREDARMDRMSDEDRAWQAASLQRDREARERAGSPAEPGA